MLESFDYMKPSHYPILPILELLRESYADKILEFSNVTKFYRR